MILKSLLLLVSGEFSNGGQPMRRFTQTFVLAAETPKKYYVHNDIFRYQDMFGDEEIEPESGRTDEEEQQVDQERTVSEDISQQQNQNNQGGGYYGGVGVSAGVAINGGTHHDEVPVAPQAPQGIPPPMMQPIYPQTIDFHHLQQPQQQPPPPQQQQQQAPPQQLQTTPQPPPQLQPQQQQVTGVSIEQQVNQGQSGMTAAIPDVIPDVYQHPEQEEEEEEEAEEEATTAGAAITTEEHHEEEEEDNLKPSLDNNYPSLDQENDLPHETAPTTNEPSTYATRLKSGTSASGTTTNLNVSPQGPAKSPSSPSPGTRLDSRNELNLTSGRGQAAVRGGQRGGATVRGMSRGNDRPGQPRPIPSDDGNNFGDNDKRRSGPQQYPDNQQLFLGNLPLNATESDLRDLFGKFGPIIDLRIMNKPNMKGQTGNKLPNYGFIVFEDVSTVQTVLNSRPFFFPPENGTKLNVEEKKTRARGSTDGRIGSSGDVRPGARMGPGGAPSLRGGNRGGFLPGRGFTHGRGSTPMRPGGPSFIQRNSVQR
ncbi:ras GTPase-activating protein-binding protein 2 isoform X2 [Lycorma delicatula]|uniref:ras GTPase-activating protein-binding protein 2 isoform X2 n=1 Tax=Lycorma delicatula TaxID=130591 RepID=UPI003F5191C4